MGQAKKQKGSPPGPRGPRPSKATRWRALVLILVHVVAAIHIAHWMSTGSTMTPLEPSEAMEFSKHSVVNAGLVFFALTILSTLVLGRWFCGWACHVVALQDLSRAILLKVGVRPRPLRSRWMLWMPVLAALYMFVWPLAYRLYVGDSIAVREVQLTREGYWDTFPSWGPALLTFFVAGFACVYFLGAKGFCTYACPYGAVFSFTDRFSPGRIRVNDDCVECGHCTLTCTSNVDVSREVHDYGMVVDPGCMKCMDCVSVCPENALSFGMGKPALFAKPRKEKRKPAPRLPRFEELFGVVAFAFGYVAMRGFNQERGFLLSVGVASCFAFLALTVLRLVRKTDVKIPGVVLKAQGKLRPIGMAVAGGTLALAACAVPYGLMPELSTIRANDAWAELEPTRARFHTPNPAPLTDDELELARELRRHATIVRERTLEPSLANTERLAWGARFEGDLDAYGRHLDELVRFGNSRVEHLSLYAAHMRLTGDAAAAAGAYRAILESYPGEVAAAVQLCGILFEQGDLDGALRVCRDARAAAPESAELIAQEGLLHAGKSDFELAITMFERAIEADAGLHAAREMLWQTQLQLGRTDDAILTLEAALAAEPGLVAARDRLFRIWMQQERPDDALQLLREGLAIDGAPREFRAHVAQILLVSGRQAEAVEEARVLEREAGTDPALMGVVREVFRQAGAAEDLARVEATLAGRQ